MNLPTLKSLPDKRGYFGAYGGRFVPETLVEPLRELESAFRRVRRDASFHHDLHELLAKFKLTGLDL